MKGDFTRWTYTPAKNYSAVLLQQGRVLLDADWNEQREIDRAQHRTVAADVIGRAAGPLDAMGFAIVAVDEDGDGATEALRLRAGRYYVDGILCQLHEDTALSHQPDLPGFDPTLGLASGRYAVYLDVWERHVTYIEDGEIKEKALGGPDHTTRAQVVAQARLLPVGLLGAHECETLHDPTALAAVLEGTRGRMAASVDPAPVSVDPCIVPPTAGYRGLENQLYRVEIHRAGDDGAVTFKWSRDNGSVVTAWDAHPDPAGEPALIQVADLGPDEEHGFQVSDLLVELHDDSHDLAPGPGLLARIDRADEASRTLTLKDAMDSAGNAVLLSSIHRGDDALHPRVRRWDCTSVRRIDAVDQVDGSGVSWIKLEQGVRVRFEHGGGRTFRSGDYWLIPARTVDGTITWSPDDLQKPGGASHHYACLAIVERHADGHWSVERTCQTSFPSASSMVQMHYAGGDGQQGVLGTALPSNLRVQVLNGGVPVPGAKILFRLVEPPTTDGHLTDPELALSGKTLTVSTGGGGIAQVRLTMPSEDARIVRHALIDQRVQAILLDACGAETDQLIRFTAHESQAQEVRYDNAVAPMAQLHAAGHETDNVQRALDVLTMNPHLDYIGGDGQEALPANELPNELVVRVGNGAFPRAGVNVVFTLVDLADGSLATDESWAGALNPTAPGSIVTQAWPSGHPRVVTVPTSAEGLAWVRWRLGATASNRRPGVLAGIVLPSPYDTFNPSAAIRFGAQTQDQTDGTCGEIVIRPDSDLAVVFGQIPEGGDARICIHPGLFTLRTPLAVRKKGHLIITGAGAGTVFRGETLDQVLLFAECNGVSIRDLTIEARAGGHVGDGLLGALTFLDCGEVDCDRVTVRSTMGGTRRLSGIEARVESAARATSRVHIQHCEVEVGHGQTGILVVDAAEADLRNNHVTCPEIAWPLRKAMFDDEVVAWIGRRLLGRIRIVPENDEFNSEIFVGSPWVELGESLLKAAGLPYDPLRITLALGLVHWPVTAGRILTFTVDPQFGNPEHWGPLLEANPMTGWNSRGPNGQVIPHPDEWIQANLKRLRKDVAQAAFVRTSRVTIPAAARASLSAFAELLAGDNNVAVGSQGIVIGGKRTPPVGTTVTKASWNSLFVAAPYTPSARVTGNTISGFAQGIHIGTSHNDHTADRHRRLRSYRARVSDNTVQLRVPSLARERHGIFVGNAHQVQVCDNHVELVFPAIDKWQGMAPLDGIRLWGTYGPMLHVTGNHCAGVSTGVRVKVLNLDLRPNPGLSWLARDNSYAGFGATDNLSMG